MEMQVEGMDRAPFTQGLFQDVEVLTRTTEAMERQHRQRAVAVAAVGEGGAVGEIRNQGSEDQMIRRSDDRMRRKGGKDRPMAEAPTFSNCLIV
jgi:hypothetical protein